MSRKHQHRRLNVIDFCAAINFNFTFWNFRDAKTNFQHLNKLGNQEELKTFGVSERCFTEHEISKVGISV